MYSELAQSYSRNPNKDKIEFENQQEIEWLHSTKAHPRYPVKIKPIKPYTTKQPKYQNSILPVPELHHQISQPISESTGSAFTNYSAPIQPPPSIKPADESIFADTLLDSNSSLEQSLFTPIDADGPSTFKLVRSPNFLLQHNNVNVLLAINTTPSTTSSVNPLLLSNSTAATSQDTESVLAILLLLVIFIPYYTYEFSGTNGSWQDTALISSTAELTNVVI